MISTIEILENIKYNLQTLGKAHPHLKKDMIFSIMEEQINTVIDRVEEVLEND